MSNPYIDNGLMQLLSSGQMGPNIGQKIDENKRRELAERERLQQNEALRQQQSANLRSTQLGNTQQARSMAQAARGPGNDLSKLPQGAARFLPPEVLANPNAVDKAQFNQAAIQAVKTWQAQGKPASTADQRLVFDKKKDARDQAQEVAEREQTQAQESERAENKKNYAREKLGTVNAAVDNALKIVKDNPVATGGFFGGINSNVPGTDSYDLGRVVDTLQSNLSFDELQRMRDASATGGALGSVSERELQLLGSTVASLDTGMSRDMLIQNLEKVRGHYQKFLESVDGGGQGALPDGVAEDDIEATMAANNMTRQQVLERLNGG